MIRYSIIIVNYNSLPDICECLDSLLQTISKLDEVIVVDNNSKDKSPEIIQEYYPWVKLIKNNKNIGYGGGNNIGANFARGKYLVFLNPDTIVKNDWLEQLILVFKENQNVGLVTPKILLKDDHSKINACGNDLHLSGITLCRNFHKPEHHDNEITKLSAISGAAFTIEKELFFKLGGFDESFFMYMEDTDISLRSRLMGYKCFLAPESIIYHSYELRFGPYKTYYQERNRYLMLLKNYRIITIIFLLPALFFSEIITWGFVIIKDKKRAQNKINAYLWILNNIKKIIKSHKKVQKKRKVRDRDLLLESSYKINFSYIGSGIIYSIADAVFNSIYFLLFLLYLLLIWW